jgi:hypothetical protein
MSRVPTTGSDTLSERRKVGDPVAQPRGGRGVAASRFRGEG